ncbi:MAG: hypothetical protein K8R36_12700 [Planctomycetales bacterium]|nr:hypothetical protein [Planctomycetales bacterium]
MRSVVGRRKDPGVSLFLDADAPIGLAAILLGGIALTVVSFGAYIAMDIGMDLWSFFLLPRSPALGALLMTYFFSISLTAAVGTTGLFLAWGIRSSLEYRPVARI